MDKKAPFAYFYWDLLRRFNIKPIEGLFLTLIYGLSQGKNGHCYASRRRLGQYLNVTDISIYDLIKRLEKKGLLVRGERTHVNTGALKVSDEVAQFIYACKWGWIEEKNEERFGMGAT